MSVRMALAKLSACAAGGALIGGGAVHVAETPSTARPQYVKHATASKPSSGTHARRHLARRGEAHGPRKVRRIRRTVTRTISCEQPQQMAMVPMPAPMLPPLPQAPMSGGGGSAPVVIGGGPIGGFGGGFFGGFFGGGGGGGGSVVITSTTSGGSTSTSGGSTSTSGGST